MLSVAMPMQCSRHCSKHVYHRCINTCAFRSAGAVCSDAAGAYLLEKRHSSHWISSSNNGAKKEALRPGPAVWKHVLHDDSCHDCPVPTPTIPSSVMCQALWDRCAFGSDAAAWNSTGGARRRNKKPGSSPWINMMDVRTSRASMQVLVKRHAASMSQFMSRLAAVQKMFAEGNIHTCQIAKPGPRWCQALV